VGALARADPAVPAGRVAVLFAVAALFGASPASASGWTLAHARAVLGSQTIDGWDDGQSDDPYFAVTLDRARLTGLRRAGGRFTYRGPAHDTVGGGTILVAFTVQPRGASEFRVLAFHGPPPDTSQPALPLRAAFTYGWFPEAWDQQHFLPFTRYRPAAGYYDSSDAELIRRQIDAMRYGKIGAGIYSWWGPGSYTDLRFHRYLAAARQTPFRWAVYYEAEGYGDPSPDAIRRDLEYIRDQFASQPAYLKLNGRFVVFVYGGVESCSVADRWKQANTVGAYVVLPAFTGFRDCPNQADSWHFYSAALPEFQLHGYAYGICPGFWRADEEEARQGRSLETWKQSIRDMVASGEQLQLVITFNEWGEGTSVEPADPWQTPSGYGAYLDALHTDGG
jgi:hypothetical protein